MQNRNNKKEPKISIDTYTNEHSSASFYWEKQRSFFFKNRICCQTLFLLELRLGIRSTCVCYRSK